MIFKIFIFMELTGYIQIYIIICFGVLLSFKVGQNENVCCRGDDSGTDKGIVHG
jgi:hypothetical protein